MKGLKHKTEWVEYPDIEDLYKKLGIPAVDKSNDGSPYYTLPIIHDPATNAIIADSYSIAKYLDETYPDTPVLLPKETLAFHEAFQTAWWRIQGAIFTVVVYPVWSVLPPRSQEFFRTTREKPRGKQLEDICEESDWKTAERAFSMVGEWLDKNEEGKRDLVMGDRICFADLTILGALLWIYSSHGAESEGWKRVSGWNDGRWQAMVERAEKYHATLY